MRQMSLLGLMLLCLSACNNPTPVTTADSASGSVPISMPNPASVNCINAGGKEVMQTRGDGGEYSVCVFEDNRQCEEWALFRGQCPAGGLKLTGYITPASQYCAMTGGEYAVVAADKGSEDQGTCSKAGKTCDAQDYYNGKCDL